jgi:hypothetical protein
LQGRLKRKNDQYRPCVTNLHRSFQAIQSITAQAYRQHSSLSAWPLVNQLHQFHFRFVSSLTLVSSKISIGYKRTERVLRYIIQNGKLTVAIAKEIQHSHVLYVHSLPLLHQGMGIINFEKKKNGSANKSKYSRAAQFSKNSNRSSNAADHAGRCH